MIQHAQGGQPPHLPNGLIRSIREGRCVALVGAGFSAAAGLPKWRALLEHLMGHPKIRRKERLYLRERLEEGSANANEEVAQQLLDTLGRRVFIGELRKQLTGRAPNSEILDRTRWLRGTPFRAILTTNFDDVLRGRVFGKEISGQVFGGDPHLSWAAPFFDAPSEGAETEGPPVIKLHGDLSDPESVVFSRLGYRQRLYGDGSAYLNFLRTLFLYNSVLYIGFSFTDTYLNELRSETLALLGPDAVRRRPSYAVLSDVPDAYARYLRQHEGIEVIPYDSHGGENHGEFDRILAALHEATSPVAEFGRLLSGKRILWVEADRESVSLASDEFFPAATRAASGDECVIEFVPDAAEAMDRLGRAPADPGYDLVITKYEEHRRTGVQVLEGVRSRNVQVPVMFFASGARADDRKTEVLKLGAQGYYHTWAGLRKAIEAIFTPGSATG